MCGFAWVVSRIFRKKKTEVPALVPQTVPIPEKQEVPVVIRAAEPQPATSPSVNQVAAIVKPFVAKAIAVTVRIGEAVEWGCTGLFNIAVATAKATVRFAVAGVKAAKAFVRRLSEPAPARKRRPAVKIISFVRPTEVAALLKPYRHAPVLNKNSIAPSLAA